MLITSSVQKLDPPLTQKIGDSVSGTHLLMHILNPFRQDKDHAERSQHSGHVRVEVGQNEAKLMYSIMRAEETVFKDSDLVIRPSINDVGSAAFGQFDDTEQLGYEEGIVRIREWIQGIDRESPLYRAIFVTPNVDEE